MQEWQSYADTMELDFTGYATDVNKSILENLRLRFCGIQAFLQRLSICAELGEKIRIRT